jgi:hypothetical protein
MSNCSQLLAHNQKTTDYHQSFEEEIEIDVVDLERVVPRG